MKLPNLLTMNSLVTFPYSLPFASSTHQLDTNTNSRECNYTAGEAVVTPVSTVQGDCDILLIAPSKSAKALITFSEQNKGFCCFVGEKNSWLPLHVEIEYSAFPDFFTPHTKTHEPFWHILKPYSCSTEWYEFHTAQ